MGDYLYILRSPKLARRCVIRLPDGSTDTQFCGSTAFQAKAPRWGGLRRHENALATRMEGAWGDRRPKFVVITETLADDLTPLPRTSRYRIKVGQHVRYWQDGRAAPIALIDGSDYGGSHLYGLVLEVLPEEVRL